MVLYFIKPELLPIEVIHWRIGTFDLLCCYDLDLDPMTFTYELDPYFVEIYRMCENELLRQGFQKLSYYRHIDGQTDKHDRNYIPRRFAGGQQRYDLPVQLSSKYARVDLLLTTPFSWQAQRLLAVDCC